MALRWIKKEIEKSRFQLTENIRLRMGLWLILLIGFFYINLVLLDWNDEKKTRLIQLERLHSEQQQLEGSNQWQERLEEVKALLAKQSDRFAKAESEAYGRADIQAFVAQLLNEHELDRVRMELSTSSAPEQSTGLVPVQLQLSGEARVDKLMSVLHTLETARPAYHVTTLNVQSRSSDIVTFNLIATVWFLPWGDKQ